MPLSTLPRLPAPLLVSAMAAVASACLMMGGCDDNRTAANGMETSNTTQAKATVTSINEARTLVTQSRNDIGVALADLNLMSHQTDLTATFATYSKAVDQVAADGAKVKNQLDDMEKNSNDYIKQWEGEVAQFNNDDLRKAANDRQKQVKDTFQDTVASYEDLNHDFAPLVDKLTEIQQAIHLDLTPESVKGAQGVIDKANSDGQGVQGKADTLISKLDRYNATLAASATSAATADNSSAVTKP